LLKKKRRKQAGAAAQVRYQAHERCFMSGDLLSPAAVQELVTAWKLMRQWKLKRTR